MPGAQNPLDESILITIRPLNNVDRNDNGFDDKLIPLINSEMMMAHQFGIGYDGFQITGSRETWRNWLGDNGSKLAAIIVWLGYKVLLQFDPPDNSTVLSSIQHEIDKKEWMLCSKSTLDGHVKEYVPEKASFYDDLLDDGE